ncbi:MAG TPA: MalY/PatB family protein [Spirochaetia bacterium]|nr:MalY/PatB family protein [Spirochaetia bacterium]
MSSRYGFETVIERRGTGAIKWDAVPADVLPMWVADMDFKAPPEVAEALSARLEHSLFGYTRVPQNYLEAFARWEHVRNNFPVAAADVIPAPGVMPAIRFAIDAFTEPGDRIVIQPPVYFPFYRVIEGRDRVIDSNPLVEESGTYRMDLDAFERSASAGAKMILLCSPHNPVGRVWTAEELAAVADICSRYGIIAVSDEIHSDIIMPGHAFHSFVPVAREAGCAALSLFAPSKTFNIAGLASCTAVASDEVTAHAYRKNLQAGNLELPNLLSIVAAEAAYLHGGRWLDELIEYLHENFDYMQSYLAHELPEVRLSPLEGTYIAWLDFRAFGLTDDELSRRLMSVARVRLNEGRQFGAEGSGFQRLNFACPRALLEEGLSRIASAFRHE